MSLVYVLLPHTGSKVVRVAPFAGKDCLRSVDIFPRKPGDPIVPHSFRLVLPLHVVALELPGPIGGNGIVPADQECGRIALLGRNRPHRGRSGQDGRIEEAEVEKGRRACIRQTGNADKDGRRRCLGIHRHPPLQVPWPQVVAVRFAPHHSRPSGIGSTGGVDPHPLDHFAMVWIPCRSLVDGQHGRMETITHPRRQAGDPLPDPGSVGLNAGDHLRRAPIGAFHPATRAGKDPRIHEAGLRGIERETLPAGRYLAILSLELTVRRGIVLHCRIRQKLIRQGIRLGRRIRGLEGDWGPAQEQKNKKQELRDQEPRELHMDLRQRMATIPARLHLEPLSPAHRSLPASP